MFADHILGPVKQWGFLVRDLDQAMACWIEQLGVGPWWGYRNVSTKSIVDGRETDIEMSVGLAYQQGMQIELIHQTNDADSPYSYFYRDSDDAQVLQQIAYMVPDVDLAIEQCQQRGMEETGRIVPAPGLNYVYMSSPAMRGIVIELMPHDQGFLDDYDRNAATAETWDGSDPYRLISL
ncbi:MAG: methylmalonyl-CoA/ethylmalonyl-CoA epimerase [Halioglobus sp.]|jgi:methylmalonyl-CoA/ethylmalonyl-CoA epimerase